MNPKNWWSLRNRFGALRELLCESRWCLPAGNKWDYRVQSDAKDKTWFQPGDMLSELCGIKYCNKMHSDNNRLTNSQMYSDLPVSTHFLLYAEE